MTSIRLDSLESLPLGAHARKALARLGVRTASDLVGFDPERITVLPGCGQATVWRIQNAKRMAEEMFAGKPRTVGMVSLPTVIKTLSIEQSFEDMLSCLGGRARNALTRLRVDSPRMLLALREDQVQSLRSCGAATWHEIAALQEHIIRVAQCPKECLQSSVKPPNKEPFENALSRLGPRARRALETLGVTSWKALGVVRESAVVSLRSCGVSTWHEIAALQRTMAAEEIPSGEMHDRVDGEEWSKPAKQLSLHQLPLFSSLTGAIPSPNDLHPSYLPHTPLTDLSLPVRAQCALGKLRIANIGQLLVTPSHMLQEGKNFGEATLRQVRDAVEEAIFVQEQVEPMPQASFSSFESLVHYWLTGSFPADRTVKIMEMQTAAQKCGG